VNKIKKFFQILIQTLLTLTGIFIGFQIGAIVSLYNLKLDIFQLTSIKLILIMAGGLGGFWISPIIIKQFNRGVEWVINTLASYSRQELISGIIGLIVGLIINTLLFRPLFTIPFEKIPVIGDYLKTVLVIFITILLSYIGILTGIKIGLWGGIKSDLPGIETKFRDKLLLDIQNECFKILDTSVIIDGRILDIARTGFIAGVLVIPKFVLEELQKIADSGDAIKRNRGRRGLDILNKMRRDQQIPIHIYENDIFKAKDVDDKLIALALQLKGKIITQDYNLNKVAQVHGIDVLNINELANALKPVVLPGEELKVHLIKEGKEYGQGVAYLDDGTMIVVEGGRRYIGEQIKVQVTSVLQTVAGKMIFARPV